MMKKILALLLICTMLLTILASCKDDSKENAQSDTSVESTQAPDNTPNDTGSTQEPTQSDEPASSTQTPDQSDEPGDNPDAPPAQTEEISIIADGKLNVRFIYSHMEAAKNPLLDAKIDSVLSTITKKTGISITGLNSYTASKDPNSYDILIGTTGFDESIEAAKDLRLKDYNIIISGKKIVIVGGSVSALISAITSFTSKVITPQVKDFSGNLVFTSEHERLYRATYASENVMINGVDLKDYTLVYPKNYRMAEKEITYMLKEVIATKYGYELPVKTDNKESEHEILIGQTKRTTIAAPALTEYTVEVTDKNVQILAGCTSAYDYIDDLFSTQFLPNNKIETVKIDAIEDYTAKKDSMLETTGDIRVIFHNVYGGAEPEDGIYTNPDLRWNLISNLYTEYQADVLCLQEFNTYPRTGKDATTGLLKRLEELGYQETPLTAYRVVINKNSKGIITGTSIQANATDSQQYTSTPIFYNPEKLELIKSGDYIYTSGLTDEEIEALYDLYKDKLGTRYDDPKIPSEASQQQWDYERYNDNFRYGGLSKMASWAIFKDKTTGKLFSIVSTHMDHQNTAYSNARRDKESKELLNEINTNILVGEYANIPMIIGGDVNTSYAREVDRYNKENNTPVGALQNFEAAGFSDVQKTFADAEQGATCLGYANFDKDKGYFTSVSASVGASKDAIDHCLYKGAVTPTLFDIMNHNFARRTSDHVPLVVDFKFN